MSQHGYLKPLNRKATVPECQVLFGDALRRFFGLIMLSTPGTVPDSIRRHLLLI